jgi:hypothetical protein
MIQYLVDKSLPEDASGPNLPRIWRHLIMSELQDPSSVLGLSPLSTSRSMNSQKISEMKVPLKMNLEFCTGLLLLFSFDHCSGHGTLLVLLSLGSIVVP